ncbi:MAG: ASCH domain-containing protein [Pirellulales bacterium]|nr:ASCH domain-containing protein [Pirellulales bacterium]
MKALSVKQPWANMIAWGEKTIETRTWSTKHRGPLLIVSSKEPDIAPAGFALAVADLVDCRPMSVLDEAKAKCSNYKGAYSWILENVRSLHPFPVRGQPSLFDVDDDLIEY